MNVNEKIKDFETHYLSWVDDYQKKRKETINARKAIEALCKIIILRKKGDSLGTRIIMGTYIPEPIERINIQAGTQLNLATLINYVGNELHAIPSNFISQLSTIRGQSNDTVHDANIPQQIVTPEHMDICYANLKPIVRWFYKDLLKSNIPQPIQITLDSELEEFPVEQNSQTWLAFSDFCHSFDDRRYQYILVSPKTLSANAQVVKSFAKLPWRLVIDFNPKSDEQDTGLLKAFIDSKGNTNKRVFTLDDARPLFEPSFPHYWFMANGNSQVQSITNFSEWRTKKYPAYISTLYSAFKKDSYTKNRRIVFIDIPKEYVLPIVYAINTIDEDNVNFLICDSVGETYDALKEQGFNNVEFINISPAQISAGIMASTKYEEPTNAQSPILIPAIDEKGVKSFVEVKREHFEELQYLGIELLFQNIEKIDSPDLGNDFYRGGKISWLELAQQKDVERSSFSPIKEHVATKLRNNRLSIIELIHDAGAGGTTLARRVAYFLSHDYPTVVLKKYIPKKTFAGLDILFTNYSRGKQPLLILIESFEIADYDRLYSDLASAKRAAIVLVIKRGLTQIVKDKKFVLKSELDSREIMAFQEKFGTAVPQRKKELSNIRIKYNEDPNYISPFIFGLVAFEREFNGIEDYVVKSMYNTTLEQKKLVGYLCIIYHYTQRAVPAELFSSLLNVSRDKCDLHNILGNDNPVFDILHQESNTSGYNNHWRPRHEILGEEAMKILIAGSTIHKRDWHSNLISWLDEIIEYIHQSVSTLNSESKAILDALFVERSDSMHDSQKDSFTDVFDGLDAISGTAIFTKLTDLFPEEAHYHGHFARYLYNDEVGIKDYQRAIVEAERALTIESDDSNLTHTLGMCFSKLASDEMVRYSSGSTSQTEDDILILIEKACKSFDDSIALDSKNTYAHHAQILLILKALDFGYKCHSSKSREDFLTNPANDWYAQKLDKASWLIEDALFIIDNAKGVENTTKLNKSKEYIDDSQARFFASIGEPLRAKNFYQNLINKPQQGSLYLMPHYRRMFIVSLLASKTIKGLKESPWSEVSESELAQCADYLKTNIKDDPKNTYNIRLWLSAIRFLKIPPSLDECIQKLSTWSQNLNQTGSSLLEGYFYLYVLTSIKAIESGNIFDKSAVQSVAEIKDKMKGFIKNEKFCFEWYGNGNGIKRMINHKSLGEMDAEFFLRNRSKLSEVTGRIKRVINRQQGIITLDCGLEAFFVPEVGGGRKYTDVNTNDKVKFYLGFRYDQLQAWSVLPFTENRSTDQNTDDILELNDFIADDPQVTVEELKPNPIEDPNMLSEEKLPGLKILGMVDLGKVKDKKPKKRF